jgi:hypothetical protein
VNDCRSILLSALLAGLGPLRADVDSPPPALIRVEIAAIRAKAERELFRRVPGSTKDDYKFQSFSYKYDPAKPVNAEILTVVYNQATVAESRSESLGPELTRLIQRRRQYAVEMTPEGTVVRLTFKWLEETNVVQEAP